MEPLGRSLEYSKDSLGCILKAPHRGFLKANPRPHQRSDLRPKIQEAVGFWPRVWPRMRQRVCQKKIPKGAFNILPWESFEYSRDLPRGSIHHDTPKAFPQIVILSRSQRTQVKKQVRNLCVYSRPGDRVWLPIGQLQCA